MQRSLLAWLRLDLVRLLLLALPALAVDVLLQRRVAPLWQQPGQALLLLSPLALGSAVLWYWARRDSPRALGNGFLVFFLTFCLLLAVATSGDLLTGKRELQGTFGEQEPRRHLGLNFLGDWHYRVAPKMPPLDDLVVLTLPFKRDQNLAEFRRTLAQIIQQAVDHGVRGLALDYYLERKTLSDALLRHVLQEAEKADMPVIFGYRRMRQEDRWVRQQPHKSLRPLLLESRLGDLSGYREADLKVRMVTQRLDDGVSLSNRLATMLNGGPPPPSPPGPLLRFHRPSGGVPVLSLQQLDWSRLRGRFVLLGTDSPDDRVDTPWGPAQGVEVHAWAAQTLRTGNTFRYLPKSWCFPLLFLLCYLLALHYARGAGPRRLLVRATQLAAAATAAAILAMRWGRIWVDLAYPLAAIVLMTASLLVLERRRRRPHRPLPQRGVGSALEHRPGTGGFSTEPMAADAFDSFLSHSSRDKAQVIILAEALKERQLRPWLDIWELEPGQPWQEALEEIIQTVRSSAVIVGPDGLGPWEIPEMRASLSEVVRRGLPVIPVLLPGAARDPQLPLFLTQFTWVDLRGGIDDFGIDRLVWGITGDRPAPRLIPSPSTVAEG